MDKNTLYQARDRWIKEMKVTPPTVHNYSYAVKLLMEWMEENGYEDLDPALLKAFKEKLKGDLCINTRSLYLTALRNFLRFCQEEGFTELDLAEALAHEPVKMMDPESLEEALKEIDTETVLGARDAAILYLLAETEMGPTSISRLKCKDVYEDQIECMIYGSPSVQTISKDAQNAIKHYLSLREDYTDHPASAEAALFANKTNGNPVNAATISSMAKRWKEEASASEQE